MGIEQAFNDQTLLDVVSLLSARNESGRLKFAGGTMRGAFFFSKGKLVDAHLGPFSGFQAVNLAISVGKARLSFDPAIESHSSSFKIPAERLILKERFGIETAALATTKAEVASSVEKIPAASPLGPLPEPLPQLVETKTKVPDPEREVRKVACGAHNEFFIPGVDIDSSSRRNRVLLICAIFLIVIPTTVGLASYWGNSPSGTVRDFSGLKKVETLPAQVAAPTPSQPDENLNKSQPTDEPIPLRPPPSLVTNEIPTQKPETDPVNLAAVRNNEVAEVIPNPPAAPSEPPGKSTSRTIAVVVEIEEGRVTEAFIQQPQRELAAYEGTALRLARQRRFPKGTTRRATITLPVTGEQ